MAKKIIAVADEGYGLTEDGVAKGCLDCAYNHLNVADSTCELMHEKALAETGEDCIEDMVHYHEVEV